MKPVFPVVRGGKRLPHLTWGGPNYYDLPSVITPEGQVFTRWRMRWWERLHVLFTGDVYLTVHTFNDPLQPVSLEVDPPALRMGTKEAPVK